MKRKINVKGAIVSNDEKWIYDMFGVEATSPQSVEDALNEANGEDVIIAINSGGGSVFDASEIYTSIKNYEGNTEAQIVGLAASAASFIALAADKTVIAPTGQMMIHNASMVTMGDHKDMTHAANMLQGINQTIANAYKMKCGMEESDLLSLMDQETWITPQMALEYNLVDEIMFDNPGIKVAASTVSNIIPQEVIDGIRKGKLKQPEDNTQQYITLETFNQAIESLKAELTNKPKEPEQVPANKRNLSKLFLNLN
ncbi:MAG: head maturation protease, ClpP-related [Bacillus sp. (in: firmicutes)]